MPIIYDENYLRSHARAHRFIMPGDHIAASDCGFNKVKDADNQNDAMDETAQALIELIACKGWNIPHINVTFSVAGDDINPVHRVWKVAGGEQGKKWQIVFNRTNYTFRKHEINIAPDTIIFPEGQLDFHEDGHTAYSAYAGKDWMRDEDLFFNTQKFNSKKLRRPRLYLRYEYKDGMFQHTDEDGTEYTPLEHEPKQLPYQAVINKANRFFYNVMRDLKALPDDPAGAYGKWRDLLRIEKTTPPPTPTLWIRDTLFAAPPEKGIILPIEGSTLLGRDITVDTNLPNAHLADKRFRYAFSEGQKPLTELFNNRPTQYANHLFKIDLKYANDIYVLDEMPIARAYDSYLEMADRDHQLYLGIESIADICEKILSSVIKLEDYKNNFTNPIYMINRPLWHDEASYVCEIGDTDKKKTQPRLRP